MKTYENKKLNQLLQEQELIIKRNGYCFKFGFNTRNNILSCKIDDRHIRTLDCSEKKVLYRTLYVPYLLAD